MITTGENAGEIFGTIDFGVNVITSSGFSLSATGGPTIYNNENENFASEDISGGRVSGTVVGGAEGVAAKYEYTKGTSGTTSHHIGIGIGGALTIAKVPIPVSGSFSFGHTNTKKLGSTN